MDKFDAKVAYCLGESGNEYDQGLIAFFKQVFEAAGGTVITDSFPTGNSDFNSYLNKAKSEGADVIFTPISIAYAVEDAFAKYDIDTLVDLYEEDAEIEDTLYQLITDRCGNFDYDCFVFAEAFANELPDTMLKLELNRYLSNNSKNKIKAFMQGEWLIIYDEAIGEVATVKCIVNEDDSKCVGYLTSFSSYMVEYHYAENDVYWSGFVFDGDQPITVNNMLRHTSGHFEYVPAKVELSLEKEEMYITIFTANTVSPVRTCRKIQTQE
jgi:hypothetical protein